MLSVVNGKSAKDVQMDVLKKEKEMEMEARIAISVTPDEILERKVLVECFHISSVIVCPPGIDRFLYSVSCLYGKRYWNLTEKHTPKVSFMWEHNGSATVINIPIDPRSADEKTLLDILGKVDIPILKEMTLFGCRGYPLHNEIMTERKNNLDKSSKRQQESKPDSPLIDLVIP